MKYKFTCLDAIASASKLLNMSVAPFPAGLSHIRLSHINLSHIRLSHTNLSHITLPHCCSEHYVVITNCQSFFTCKYFSFTFFKIYFPCFCVNKKFMNFKFSFNSCKLMYKIKLFMLLAKCFCFTQKLSSLALYTLMMNCAAASQQ